MILKHVLKHYKLLKLSTSTNSILDANVYVWKAQQISSGTPSLQRSCIERAPELQKKLQNETRAVFKAFTHAKDHLYKRWKDHPNSASPEVIQGYKNNLNGLDGEISFIRNLYLFRAPSFNANSPTISKENLNLPSHQGGISFPISPCKLGRTDCLMLIMRKEFDTIYDDHEDGARYVRLGDKYGCRFDPSIHYYIQNYPKFHLFITPERRDIPAWDFVFIDIESRTFSLMDVTTSKRKKLKDKSYLLEGLETTCQGYIMKPIRNIHVSV